MGRCEFDADGGGGDVEGLIIVAVTIMAENIANRSVAANTIGIIVLVILFRFFARFRVCVVEK